VTTPTRPAAGAAITTAWGQYVHDRANLWLGRGVVTTTLAADTFSLSAGGVWLPVPFTGNSKWDPYILHDDPVFTYQVDLDIAGLWMLHLKVSMASAAGAHMDMAGVSYGAGLGSQPLQKDWRTLQPVAGVINHHCFGPWFVVSGGTGGSNDQVQFWMASTHASGGEAVNATGAHGEASAILIQPVE
jgi:hypothetical protein